MMDLMGSDLPMPEDVEENDVTTKRKKNIGVSDSMFKWVDGVLLKAIKNGDWVLLDELNLASQSVLEGLNSCLDHRANIYIPELGKTFECPSTFKLFAAQNPMSQGGGRKGLPKSFLNRFTKVYIEALSVADLNKIVQAKFPQLDTILVGKMITFNSLIHYDISEKCLYGQQGKPWEFNLRDIFRWCDLVCCDHKENEMVDVGKFVDTIYTQRLRTEVDRSMLVERYEECFGSSHCIRTNSTFRITDAHVEIGGAILVRDLKNICSFENSVKNLGSSFVFRSLYRPMEAVAYCVKMNWPCLLVGHASSGKTTLLKVLSESCNMHLEEVVLTTSSDVNELIGGFEQVDTAEIEATFLNSLEHIYDHAFRTLIMNKSQVEILEEISKLHWNLSNSVAVYRGRQELLLSNDNILFQADVLLQKIEKASSLCFNFRQSCSLLISSARDKFTKLIGQTKNKQESNSFPFRWKDGILVEALERGYWLHLENVNFCSSSVLDRLNPLMEFGGKLVLTECGSSDSDMHQSGSRVVEPHPNFRLFLSMNPSSGEVSRAMRNRCVEVCLISSNINQIGSCSRKETIYQRPSSSIETLDTLDCLWHVGLKSAALAKVMLNYHHQEFMHGQSNGSEYLSSRNVKEWATLTVSALNRGQLVGQALQNSFQIAYEVHDTELKNPFSFDDITVCRDQSMPDEALVEAVNLEKMLILGNSATSDSDARLIKFFTSESTQLPLGISCFNENIALKQFGSQYEKFSPPLTLTDERMEMIPLCLVAAFTSKTPSKDALRRSFYLDGFSSKYSSALKFMSMTYQIHLERAGLLKVMDRFFSRNLKEVANLCSTVAVKNVISHVEISCTRRLPQMFQEHITYNILQDKKTDNNINSLSAIEVSFCYHEGIVDRSAITCPVTPLLYPLIKKKLMKCTNVGRILCLNMTP